MCFNINFEYEFKYEEIIKLYYNKQYFNDFINISKIINKISIIDSYR